MIDNIIYLNSEYDKIKIKYQKLMTSPWFKIGSKIYKIPLIRWLWNIFKKNTAREDECLKYNLFLNKEDLQWQPKVAIYQVIIGNYDNVVKPLALYPEIYDYFIFTDTNIEYTGWKTKEIPVEIKKMKNPVLINRYFKMHPHELFQEYEYSVYIDGNIRIVSDIRPMLRQVSVETGIAMHRHYLRDCIYREAKACIKLKKGNKKLIREQMKRYKKSGFPQHWGLFEGGVIVTNLINTNATSILRLWWHEFLSTGSLRDQLSLPYILWNNGYSLDSVGHFGIELRENPKLDFSSHNMMIH